MRENVVKYIQYIYLAIQRVVRNQKKGDEKYAKFDSQI